MLNDDRIKIKSPSPWVTRFADRIPPGPVLDLACGGGRHGRYLLDRGYPVTLVDRDISKLADLKDNAMAKVFAYDLESGSPWPFADEEFSGVVVVNYLYRPLFPHLLASLRPSGVLIYQTFAQGNEKYGRPRNPDFLLRPDELLQEFGAACEIIGFEQGFMPDPDRVVQSLCAVKR